MTCLRLSCLRRGRLKLLAKAETIWGMGGGGGGRGLWWDGGTGGGTMAFWREKKTL